VPGCVTCCAGSGGRGFVIVVLGGGSGGWHIPLCYRAVSNTCTVLRGTKVERETCEGEVINYSKDRQGGDNRESSGASLCVKLGNRMRKTTMREDSRLFVAVVMRVAEDCSEYRPCPAGGIQAQGHSFHHDVTQLPRASRA